MDPGATSSPGLQRERIEDYEVPPGAAAFIAARASKLRGGGGSAGALLRSGPTHDG